MLVLYCIYSSVGVGNNCTHLGTPEPLFLSLSLSFVQIPKRVFERRNTGEKVVKSNKNSKLESKEMCLTIQWNCVPFFSKNVFSI